MRLSTSRSKKVGKAGFEPASASDSGWKRPLLLIPLSRRLYHHFPKAKAATMDGFVTSSTHGREARFLKTSVD